MSTSILMCPTHFTKFPCLVNLFGPHNLVPRTAKLDVASSFSAIVSPSVSPILAMADAKNVSNETKQTLVFVYGTLKKEFPNHHLLQELMSQKEAAYVGTCMTHQATPLVIGPYGIPYMLSLPGSGGHRINGELYSVSTHGLVRLDELEGASVGHYERRPFQVIMREKNDTEEGVVLVDAEAYFAHRSFGERMWVRCGRVGLGEYSLERDACGYVKKVDRAEGGSILDEIERFLSGTA